jgi:hypothetical protein
VTLARKAIVLTVCGTLDIHGAALIFDEPDGFCEQVSTTPTHYRDRPVFLLNIVRVVHQTFHAQSVVLWFVQKKDENQQ